MHKLILAAALLTAHAAFALEPSTGKIGSYNRQTQQSGVRIWAPKDIAEIQAIIAEARKSHTQLRVKAASHSTSSLILSDGDYLSTENLTGVISIENNTVKVKSGTKVGDLAAELAKKGFSLGYAYPAFKGLTIGGLLATGAHGSSRKNTGVSSQNLLAMTLVDGSGKVRNLTPADGDAFRAAQVHLGLMGVVHDVTLRIYPEFKLQYRFEEIPGFLNAQGQAQFGSEADSEIVMWSPITNRAVKYTGNVTDKPASPKATNHLLGDSNDPDPTAEMVAGGALAMGKSSTTVNAGIEKYRLDEAINKPFIAQDTSVSSERVSYVGTSSQMLLAEFFQPQVSYTFMEIEFSFPLSQADAVLASLREICQREQLYFPISRGVFMRFAKSAGASGPLISHVERPGAASEVWVFASILDYLANGQAPHGEWSKSRDKLMQELTQRHPMLGLHWGKNTDEIFSWFNPPAKLGANLETFRQQVKAFDPDGIFANQFSTALGLVPKAH